MMELGKARKERSEMSEKMRLTSHNGRAGKNGAYSAKHNDRNFDSSADHIDAKKTGSNWTWHRYQKTDPDLTFEDAEKKFYEETFRESLDLKNARHMEKRHPENVKTMDDYRMSTKTCPEETIYQIGNKDLTVSAAVLKKIVNEQINWEIRKFPNVRLLDVALHVDEQGAPHMHKRQVWVAHENGTCIVGQNKALKEMGIERPDVSKKESRYNNAKMSYTEQCRNHFVELCRKYGLEIEIEPKNASETGLSLVEYQRRQEEKKLEDAKQAQKDISCQINNAVTSFKAQIDDYQSRMDKLSRDEEKVKIKLSDASRKVKDADKYLSDRKKEADSYVSEKNKEIEAKEAELNKRQAKLEKREKSFRNSQKRAFEEMQGMASYVQSMTEDQLEHTRAIMERIENADDFDDCVKALQNNSTGIYR